MQEQLDACRDAEEGTPCSVTGVADGACRSGVCTELTCGDGYKAPSEMCDPGVSGTDGESTCLARGFHDEGVTVACGVDCVWDTTPCSLYCGDNVVTAPYEGCDGDAPAGTCIDYGFDRGVLGCRPGVCVPGFDDCGVIGWKVGSSAALGHSDAQTLAGVLYVAGTVQGANGARGTIVRYDGTWTTIGDFPEESPSKPIPRAVFALAANDIWVAGTHNASPNIGKGFVAHYDGTSWTLPVQLDSLGAYDVWAAGPNDMHVLFLNEVRHWNGSSWTTTSLGSNSGASQLWGSGADDVYLVGESIGVRRYSAGAWAPKTAPFTKAYRVWGAGSDAVFVLAADPTEADALEVYRWTGSEWLDLELPPGGLVPVDSSGLSIWGSAASDLYVARRITQYSTGPIHTYHYDGAGWRLISDRFLPNQSFVLGGTDASHVFALASYGNVYEYAGSSWQEKAPVTSYIYRLWAASDADAFATDEVGDLYQFDGTTWTKADGVTGHLVGGSAADNVYAYDYALDRFSRYDGQTWSAPVSAGTTSNEREVLVRAQSDVYLVANNALWSWNGSTLTDLQLGVVNGATCGTVACVAYNTTKVTVSMTVGGWNELPTPPALISSAWISDDGTVLASAISGAMLRYRNGAWENVANPTGLAFIRMHGTSANDAFAFNDATGTVVHFDGATWTPVRNPAPAGSYFIDVFATAKTVFFAGAANGSAVLLHLDRLRPW